jgi:hypothetical protein
MELVKPTELEAYQAIFQTMVAVVTLEGTQEMVPLERESIEAIGHYIFDHDVCIDELPQVIPARLEEIIHEPPLRTFVVRMLMTLPLVGGEISERKIRIVDKVAQRLDAKTEEFALLEHTLRQGRRKWYWYNWRVVKHAAYEYWSKDGKPTIRDWWELIQSAFFPDLIKDPKTAARYHALKHLAPDTLGGMIYTYFKEKGFGMPGEKGGTKEKFLLHDVYHILSGYPPVIPGEMLVSVFTGGNKAYQPMDWVIVPLLQWHIGAPAITYAKSVTERGMLYPAAYFNALRRGMEMRVNLMHKWSWWEVIEERVEDIRVKYNIPPLDPLLDGTHERPGSLSLV